jgi:hypothetical protein
MKIDENFLKFVIGSIIKFFLTEKPSDKPIEIQNTEKEKKDNNIRNEYEMLLAKNF